MQARKIPLKVLTLSDEFAPGTPGNIPFVYATHIRAAMGYGGQSGLTMADMTTAINILDELRKSDTALYLNEDDYRWLAARVRSMTWQLASRAAVQFVRDITEAELVDVTEPTPLPIPAAQGEAA